jgi:hypothetical protein
MSLQLDKDARPSEAGTFFLSSGVPRVVSHHDWGWLRWTRWAVPTRNGHEGRFTSVWLFGHLQFYWGDAKHDATRTYLYQTGQLDNGDGVPYTPVSGYRVYTDKPSELRAFRWRTAGPAPVDERNMGGS